MHCRCCGHFWGKGGSAVSETHSSISYSVLIWPTSSLWPKASINIAMGIAHGKGKESRFWPTAIVNTHATKVPFPQHPHPEHAQFRNRLRPQNSQRPPSANILPWPKASLNIAMGIAHGTREKQVDFWPTAIVNTHATKAPYPSSIRTLNTLNSATDSAPKIHNILLRPTSPFGQRPTST